MRGMNENRLASVARDDCGMFVSQRSGKILGKCWYLRKNSEF